LQLFELVHVRFFSQVDRRSAYFSKIAAKAFGIAEASRFSRSGNSLNALARGHGLLCAAHDPIRRTCRNAVNYFDEQKEKEHMMTSKESLFLYEEIMLLALRDEKGTVATGFPEQVVAGAILAELLLGNRIAVEETRKQLVDVIDQQAFGDPVIDECLEKMVAAKRRAPLKIWVHRLARVKGLRHKVARQLCDRGILRAEEDKILLLFKRRIYPEIDPKPEREIIRRLRQAIFTDQRQLDPRTVVLVALASGADLLRLAFGRKELRPRKKRIEQITNGDVTGKATKEVIAACQAAVMVAVIIPAVTSTTT
jgi:hypothetical protein